MKVWKLLYMEIESVCTVYGTVVDWRSPSLQFHSSNLSIADATPIHDNTLVYYVQYIFDVCVRRTRPSST